MKEKDVYSLEEITDLMIDEITYHLDNDFISTRELYIKIFGAKGYDDFMESITETYK